MQSSNLPRNAWKVGKAENGLIRKSRKFIRCGTGLSEVGSKFEKTCVSRGTFSHEMSSTGDVPILNVRR